MAIKRREGGCGNSLLAAFYLTDLNAVVMAMVMMVNGDNHVDGVFYICEFVLMAVIAMMRIKVRTLLPSFPYIRTLSFLFGLCVTTFLLFLLPTFQLGLHV